MKTLIAFAVLSGLVATGALYATGHWIAGTFALCVSGYAVTTQDPEYDTRTPRKDPNDVD